MISDEVMAGFGRCGEWFAVDHWGVTPDLITFAKGVNSGYVPLGGVILNDAIAATFQERVYPGGLTYSGHPLACASAVASINIFKDEGIIEHARSLGTDVIGPELAKIADRHPSVGEVRGLGVFWAVELVKDKTTREPLVPYNAGGPAAAPMNEFAAACKQRGMWPFIHFNRTHVVPPCTTSEQEVREGLAILDEALEVADQHCASDPAVGPARIDSHFDPYGGACLVDHAPAVVLDPVGDGREPVQADGSASTKSTRTIHSLQCAPFARVSTTCTIARKWSEA